MLSLHVFLVHVFGKERWSNDSVFFFPVICSPAEAFFKQAIEIKENALGNDHPSLVKVSSDNSLSELNRCG